MIVPHLARLRNLLCVLLALLLSASGSLASAEGDGITTSYGYAVYGKLKYPENFQHLDYANPNAPKGGTYHFANPGTYDSFNLYALTGTPPFAIIYAMDSLMTRSLDEPGSYYGLIAETISYPKDLSWVEFKLRPEAHWSDGKPITVDDVLFTYNLFKTYHHPVFGRFATLIARAEQTGPHSVRFYLAEKNNPTALSSLALLYVLPRHYWQGRDISVPTLDPPPSSGPYKIGKFSPGRSIDFVRDPNYWGRDLPINRGRFNFDILRQDFYRDTAVINEAFLSGNIDLRLEMTATRWAFESTLPPFRKGLIKRDTVKYDNGAFLQVLWMNNARPFFQDGRVREALDLAYDYDWIRRVLLQGPHGRLKSYFANTEFAAEGLPSAGERKLLEPYRSALPPELFTEAPQFPVAGDRAHQRQNLLKAAALLKAAGYPIVDGKLVNPRTGQPIVLDIVIGNPQLERQISLLIANFKRLGIGVNLRVVDSAQMRFVAQDLNFDLIIGIPFPIVLSPNPGYELIGSLGSQSPPGSMNTGRIHDPIVDAMIQKVTTSSDRQAIVDAMRAMDRVMLWRHYGILFYHLYPAPIGEIPIAYWDRFGRPPTEPTYNFPVISMDHWWIDKAKDAHVRQELGKRG